MTSNLGAGKVYGMWQFQTEWNGHTRVCAENELTLSLLQLMLAGTNNVPKQTTVLQEDLKLRRQKHFARPVLLSEVKTFLGGSTYPR